MTVAAVVGATSMLGRALIAALRLQGYSVIRVGRGGDQDVRLDLRKGFLSQPPVGLQADVVFHCAASFGDHATESTRELYEINASGCLWVLELARLCGSRSIIYAGTVSSREDADSQGLTPYGFTKAQGENVLEWGMEKEKGRFCSLRFPQLYDTRGDCVRHQPWFGRIVAYSARGLDLAMPPSEGVRNFLHVEDAARLLLAAAESPVSGVLHASHPESLTYQAIAEIAYQVFNMGGQIVIDRAKTPFRAMNFPESSKTFDLLGERPALSIKQGLERIRQEATWKVFDLLDVT